MGQAANISRPLKSLLKLKTKREKDVKGKWILNENENSSWNRSDITFFKKLTEWIYKVSNGYFYIFVHPNFYKIMSKKSLVYLRHLRLVLIVNWFGNQMNLLKIKWKPNEGGTYMQMILWFSQFHELKLRMLRMKQYHKHKLPGNLQLCGNLFKKALQIPINGAIKHCKVICLQSACVPQLLLLFYFTTCCCYKSYLPVRGIRFVSIKNWHHFSCLTKSAKKKTKNHWKNVEKVRGKVKRNQFGLGLFGSLSLSFFFVLANVRNNR